MEIRNKDVGSYIKQKVKERGMTVTKFAGLINRSRADVYDIFKRSSIDTDLLFTISEVLNVNILEEIMESKKPKAEMATEYVLLTDLTKEEIYKIISNKYIVKEN